MGQTTQQQAEDEKVMRGILKGAILREGTRVEVTSLVMFPNRGKQKVVKVYPLLAPFGKAFGDVTWEDKSWEMSVDHIVDIYYGCVNPDRVGAPEGWDAEGEFFILSSIITITTVDDAYMVHTICGDAKLMPTAKVDEWIEKLDEGMSPYLPY